MFHSIPAAMIAGLIAFLICDCYEMTPRLYKAAAVTVGFMSHLILDELWSIECYRGRMRFKSSFGTALKIYSPKDFWANLSTYNAKSASVFVSVTQTNNAFFNCG